MIAELFSSLADVPLAARVAASLAHMPRSQHAALAAWHKMFPLYGGRLCVFGGGSPTEIFSTSHNIEALIEISVTQIERITKIMRNSVITATHMLFIRDESELLMMRRMNTGYQDDNYGLPAGHIENGELPLAATVRESLEEIGLILRPEDIKMVHVMHTQTRVHFFFTILNWQGEPQNSEPNKCDRVDWFKLNKLPSNIVPYVRDAITCILAGEHYSERGD